MVTPVHSTRPAWLVAALGYLGVREKPGPADNPVILQWAKELGGAIAKAYTHDSIPWCAEFIGISLKHGNVKWLDSLWAMDYAKYGVKLAGPAVGAVCPMTRVGGGHVAMLVGRDRAGNYVMVGGNQSDMVCIRSFQRSRASIFRWPADVPLPAQVGFDHLPLVSTDGLSVKEL